MTAYLTRCGLSSEFEFAIIDNRIIGIYVFCMFFTWPHAPRSGSLYFVIPVETLLGPYRIVKPSGRSYLAGLRTQLGHGIAQRHALLDSTVERVVGEL